MSDLATQIIDNAHATGVRTVTIDTTHRPGRARVSDRSTAAITFESFGRAR